MPVTDLFASSRRVLRELLGRSRRVALAAALVPLGSVGLPTASAAPFVSLPPEFPATPFSIRVTDMERIAGDLEQDAFRFEFQVINWSGRGAYSLAMGANVGTTTLEGDHPFIADVSIDPDGRGGAPGGQDIGPGVFDSVAIHSGDGRGDLSPDYYNEWLLSSSSTTAVHWSVYDTTKLDDFPIASTIQYQPLLWYPNQPEKAIMLVPGFGSDGLGDTAIDGGPAPYDPPSPGAGPPSPSTYRDGSLGVLDGFVIDVDDWDIGEVFSLNWFLATIYEGSFGYNPVSNPLIPIGGEYGFGIMSLVRIEPTIGSPVGDLPGPVFIGNTGFDQSVYSFYDTVYEIPNPAEFAAEFGAGITAPFLNPADNIFDAPINTRLVPEPNSVILIGSGLAGLSVTGARRRHRNSASR